MKQSTIFMLITYVRNRDNSLKDETLFDLQSSFCSAIIFSKSRCA